MYSNPCASGGFVTTATLVLAFFLISTTAWAQVAVLDLGLSGSVSNGVGGGIFSDSDVQSLAVGPLGSPLCCLISGSDGVGNFMNGTAEVDYGLLRMFVELRAEMQPDTGVPGLDHRNGSIGASVSSRDTITVSIPGGGSGTLVSMMDFDGVTLVSLGATATINSSISTSATLLVQSNGSGFFQDHLALNRDEGIFVLSGTTQVPFVDGDAFGAYPVVVPFSSDVPFVLFIAGTSGVVAFSQDLGAGSQGASDMRNTIAWLGISEVLDDQGMPIENFQISSQSGFDYEMGVPEPSMLAGQLAGIFWLAGLGRLRAAAGSKARPNTRKRALTFRSRAT